MGSPNQSVVAQPTSANHESRKDGRARDLRKQERAKWKAGGSGKKGYFKSVALINAVSLDGHDLVATQSL